MTLDSIILTADAGRLTQMGKWARHEFYEVDMNWDNCGQYEIMAGRQIA